MSGIIHICMSVRRSAVAMAGRPCSRRTAAVLRNL